MRAYDTHLLSNHISTNQKNNCEISSMVALLTRTGVFGFLRDCKWVLLNGHVICLFFNALYTKLSGWQYFTHINSVIKLHVVFFALFFITRQTFQVMWYKLFYCLLVSVFHLFLNFINFLNITFVCFKRNRARERR